MEITVIITKKKLRICYLITTHRAVARIFFLPRRRKLRLVGPTAGLGFLRRGQPAPPRQLGDLRERCKLRQRGPGESPAAERFSRVLSVQSGLSRQFCVVYCFC